jgi:hypothetical protein
MLMKLVSGVSDECRGSTCLRARYVRGKKEGPQTGDQCPWIHAGKHTVRAAMVYDHDRVVDKLCCPLTSATDITGVGLSKSPDM